MTKIIALSAWRRVLKFLDLDFGLNPPPSDTDRFTLKSLQLVHEFIRIDKIGIESAAGFQYERAVQILDSSGPGTSQGFHRIAVQPQ